MTTCDDAIRTLRGGPRNQGESLVVLDGEFKPSTDERTTPSLSPYRSPYRLLRVIDPADSSDLPATGALLFDIWWNDVSYQPPVPEGQWRMAAYVRATQHGDLLLGRFELCDDL